MSSYLCVNLPSLKIQNRNFDSFLYDKFNSTEEDLVGIVTQQFFTTRALKMHCKPIEKYSFTYPFILHFNHVSLQWDEMQGEVKGASVCYSILERDKRYINERNLS